MSEAPSGVGRHGPRRPVGEMILVHGRPEMMSIYRSLCDPVVVPMSAALQNDRSGDEVVEVGGAEGCPTPGFGREQ